MTTIAAAKSRHRLADVAARTGITLTATTGTLTVHCPMPAHGHPDRTPSMRLYLDDDRYYCFGCHAHGDVVQWARDISDLSTTDALRLLDSRQPIPNAWAGHLGVERPRRAAALAEGPDPGRTPPERVLAALEAAWSHYSHGEPHRAGVSYLLRRGIDIRVLENVTQRWEVGHTLDGVHTLTSVLRADGFADDELVDAGLSRRSWHGPGLVDAYRHRVLVPIRTAKGDVCGLVGRNVGDPHAAKYVNSPRTAIYDKSTNLYHPLPAPGHRHCRAVVVEGTLDAVALATAIIRTGATGRLWPVTQSGRELSGRQVDRIVSLCGEAPLLALDADDAGREAAARLATAFAARGVAPAHACMPEGHDPASWLAAAGCSPSAARRSLAVLTRATPLRTSDAVAGHRPVVGADTGVPMLEVDL